MCISKIHETANEILRIRETFQETEVRIPYKIAIFVFLHVQFNDQSGSIFYLYY